MCGEKVFSRRTLCLNKGSPPRVRGKVILPFISTLRARITPACAGKSKWHYSKSSCAGDPPRVCGEKSTQESFTEGSEGSPPRVRGKGPGFRVKGFPCGITPACAGKSQSWYLLPLRFWDHPRVCGEKLQSTLFSTHIQGSPPRVRGKGTFRLTFHQSRRITPACAGKSVISSNPKYNAEDHPRVCGEKSFLRLFRRRGLGSPPRVRGKDLADDSPESTGRITPACAGKRKVPHKKIVKIGDHPRVCGEKTRPCCCK